MTFEGIVFDLDGVLADSEPLHAKVWADVVAAHNISITSDWFLENWVGKPDFELSAQLVESHNLALTSDELVQTKRQAYRERVPIELKAIPGIVERVVQLTGHPRAIATTSSRRDAQAMLAALGIAEQFPHIVASDDVQRLKPDPEPYLRATQMLGLDAARCVVIEDSPVGIRSACAAGCTVLAVATTHNAELLAEATQVFPTTADALDWLDETAALIYRRQ